MISEIAWENIRWLRRAVFSHLEYLGGRMIAVDPFDPYLKRSWIKRLTASTARQRLFAEIAEWADDIKTTELTTTMDPREEGIQVARGGEEYSRLLWFLLRSHYNLYCLSTNRRTIEELALGAYAYCSTTAKHTPEFDKAAMADLRRLLRLTNIFLSAEWVHDMIKRAVANGDDAFFQIISNSVKTNIMADTSPTAVQWLLVILLWFLGGRDYGRRREFLHDLQTEDILPKSIDELSFNAELARFGLTRT